MCISNRKRYENMGYSDSLVSGMPPYAVFRDASFADDSAVASLEELFKTFSPDTIRRVI